MFSRGSGRRRWPTPGRSSVPKQPADTLPRPLGSQRKVDDIVIDPTKLQLGDDDMSKVQNVELVASYNWEETTNSRASILVPGCPPRWQPPISPQSLHEDGGIYYRDPNGARYPTFPTEPAVRAILHQKDKDTLCNTDIFGCGNTLGSLLSVARDEERTFRFGVERVGNTLFLIRKTNTPREIIEDIRGYGHSFPEAHTVWDPEVKHSASHQRIIKYDFMGFKIIVRSECDGYLPSLHPSPKPEATSSSTDLSTTAEELDLGAKLPLLRLGFTTRFQNDPKHLEITTTVATTIPQHAIFDLKTRSIKSKDRITEDLESFYPRLWVNQTPNFILAFHQWGKFEPADIHVKHIADDVKEWETRNASILRRLGLLLGKLVELSGVKGNSRFEVRRTGRRPMEVWSEDPGSSVLPDDLKALWADLDTAPEDGSDDDTKDEGTHVQDESSSEDAGDDADYLKF